MPTFLKNQGDSKPYDKAVIESDMTVHDVEKISNKSNK